MVLHWIETKRDNQGRVLWELHLVVADYQLWTENLRLLVQGLTVGRLNHTRVQRKRHDGARSGIGEQWEGAHMPKGGGGAGERRQIQQRWRIDGTVGTHHRIGTIKGVSLRVHEAETAGPADKLHVLRGGGAVEELAEAHGRVLNVAHYEAEDGLFLARRCRSLGQNSFPVLLSSHSTTTSPTTYYVTAVERRRQCRGGCGRWRARTGVAH